MFSLFLSQKPRKSEIKCRLKFVTILTKLKIINNFAWQTILIWNLFVEIVNIWIGPISIYAFNLCSAGKSGWNWKTQTIQTDTCCLELWIRSGNRTYAFIHLHTNTHTSKQTRVFSGGTHDRFLSHSTSCYFSYGRFISVYPVRIIGSHKLESSLNMCTGFLFISHSLSLSLLLALSHILFPIFLKLWINIILIVIVCFHFLVHFRIQNAHVYTTTHTHTHNSWQANREIQPQKQIYNMQ